MKIKEDLTHRIFGQLVVLNRDLSKIGLERGSYWICKCTCGKIKSISRHSLVNRGTKSCGCLQKKIASNAAIPNAGADKNYWLSKYKRRAKKLGIMFSLNEKEFYDICLLRCFYCNAFPEPKDHGYKRKNDKSIFYANGIDRVDPKLGYLKENCVPCCKICNFMKTDKTKQDFINKILEIANNLRDKDVT